ncbi:GNAT family N-acetyltransferase [Aestuariivirga sp.]|uniref:GNAT family N-acetyltransferase n=1 Tax=Aestuariivirga sp. TaxID=2650926 RepID=UPI0039E6B31B
MSDILSERLALRLVPLSALAATAKGDRDTVHRLMGPVPDDWFGEGWVFDVRLRQWTDDPAYGPWSIRALTIRQTGVVAGTLNSHGRPKPFRLGDEVMLAIEIGYTVFAPFRRLGIGEEAVRAYLDWAKAEGTGLAILSIAPENQPSRALAAKLSAVQIGSHVDEKDGPQDIFAIRL